MKQLLLDVFSKITRGDEGERHVLNSITRLLNQDRAEENYYLVPKVSLSDGTSSREVDLVLIHPTLGLYAIEVKNWSCIDDLSDENDPFRQANAFQDLLMCLIDEKLGKLPINVEWRVILPSISREDGQAFFKREPSYSHYGPHTFFKEDLDDKALFARFFGSSRIVLPNKREFMAVSELLVPRKNLKGHSIVPVITRDEIVFFDQKQLSILNGYVGGFRIIRGVAGTGKTVILTNFVNNKLEYDETNKFLILCFNKRLAENLEETFGDKFHKRNIAIQSLYGLLYRIEFDWAKVGLSNDSPLQLAYEKFETEVALDEFRTKLRARLALKPIDYFLCDETQDMPPGFIRILYEEIKDCIFFIDEAQRFYPFTMNSIAEVFHHPSFEKLSMRGRVKNLFNIYRTPSNIAQCAFDILSNDIKINDYYRKSFYLRRGFREDVGFILQDGEISLGYWNEFADLRELLISLPEGESSIVLALSNKQVDAINKMVNEMGRAKDIQAMTYESVKGLEAQNVILHGFRRYLEYKVEDLELVFRKIYVILTRAQQRLFVSMEKDSSELPIVHQVEESLRAFGSQMHTVAIQSTTLERPADWRGKVAKLKPIAKTLKESSEYIVTASELFGLIGGLFMS